MMIIMHAWIDTTWLVVALRCAHLMWQIERDRNCSSRTISIMYGESGGEGEGKVERNMEGCLMSRRESRSEQGLSRWLEIEMR